MDSQSVMECPVCLEEIGANNVVTTECGHTFHLSCMLKNLRNSEKCPMCRAVVDDEPHINHQLGDMTYEDLEDLEHSITEMTRRNMQTARLILNFIGEQIGEPNSSSRLTGHVETGVRGIVTRYVSEVVHDFVSILREWGENDVLLPDGPLNILDLNENIENTDALAGLADEFSDMSLLSNAAASAYGAAESGDPEAIALRANVDRARALIRADQAAIAAWGGEFIPTPPQRLFLTDQQRAIMLSGAGWRVVAAMRFGGPGWTDSTETGYSVDTIEYLDNMINSVSSYNSFISQIPTTTLPILTSSEAVDILNNII
jgi:hypothetical protein